MTNRDYFLAALAWLLFAVAALWLTRAGIALDTDSAMRLSGVRDLLHGQAWFDTSQHRMNVPYGLSMHWSRLVDAPLALLMLVGEDFALRAWPLALFAGVLLLLARLTVALGGRMLVTMVLALLCVEIFDIFSPGNIDHHGLQIVLMLMALLGLVEQRPRLTAVSVALGLGVGLESLLYALVAIVAACLWLRDDAVKARAFGVALAVSALVLLAATTADPYRLTPVCDTYSLFYGALLALGGAGVTGIATLPRHRMAALSALALALMGVAALLNPGCFAGPYAGMDARMKALFLDRINEARPIWRFWQLAPSEVIGGYGYGVFALAMCVFAPRGRARTLTVAFAAMALLTATLQYRATPFVIVFALPGLAAALTRLFEKRVVILAAATLLATSAAFTLVGATGEGGDHVAQRVARFEAQQACGSEKAMAPLNALPLGRVAGFVDQGPAILAYTKDSAVAGPYHRDTAGILDIYAMFTGPDPRTTLRKRGIAYLMTCRAAPDWEFYRSKGGLLAQLTAGRTPDWLKPAAGVGDVAVYKVSP